MGHQAKQIYEFGPYRLDAVERLLIRDGEVVPLQPKVFDLLLALVERHGRLLEKDELMRVVWPDAIVEEANLANNISILRKTLSENGQQFIETVPKRGYRFVAEAREVGSNNLDPTAHSHIAVEGKGEGGEEAGARQKWAGRRMVTIAVGVALLCVMWWVSFGVGMKAERTDSERARLTESDTKNPEANELYHDGRIYLEKRMRDATWKAVERFKQAIALDPNYAGAYAGLANSYVELGVNWESQKEMFPKASAAARKALALNESIAEAHTSMANVALYYDWDLDGAEREFNRALELNPNDSFAHYWSAIYLIAKGKIDESLAEGRRAMDLNPTSLAIKTRYAWLLFYAHRADEAIEQCRKVLDLDPNYNRVRGVMAGAYWLKGMLEEHVNEVILYMRGNGVSPEDLASLKQAYETSGWQAYQQKQIDLWMKRSDHHTWRHGNLAEQYARLGEKDRALDCLYKAYDEHDGWLILLKANPFYDTLRADPRFIELMRKVGLPQ